jgi:D-glycero-D-manno-heptose 1,7-bisphosphate phosphatase
MVKLVILDRDGVLNVDRHDYVKSPEELVLLDGAAEAVARLIRAGKTVVVATNQACIGRGIVPESAVLGVHEALQQRVALVGGMFHKIYCPDAVDTPRRKPNAGMLLEAMAEFNSSPSETIMVGDAARDIEAGLTAGCRAFLVRTGKGLESETLLKEKNITQYTTHDDLAAVVDFLL